MNEEENRAGDFANSLNDAAEVIRKDARRLPPLHPTPGELVDISKEEEDSQKMQTLFTAKKFKAKYGYFDVSDEEQREKLEEIMTHILQDGWLQAREEMTITKDGSAIVVLKYLIPMESLNKSTKNTPKAK